MPFNLRKEDMTIQPRGVIYLLLFFLLYALSQATAGGNMKMATVVIFIPIAVGILLVGVQYPMFSFLLNCLVIHFFSAITRYFYFSGVSVILDGSLVVCLLSILMNIASRRENFEVRWQNAFNTYTVGYLFWLLFVLGESLAPKVEMGNINVVRTYYITSPLSFLLCAALLDSPRKLRLALILLGVYVFLAAAKLYWQKSHGFDSAEIIYLIDNDAWHTHLLRDGTVRYFSFFNDAGTFGGCMGTLCVLFGVAAFVIRRFWFRWFCLAAAVLATVGMVMSGTRSAMVVPFAGMAAFVFLSKNVKVIVCTLIAGVLAFCFFYFTDIGDDNKFIRRARTAFRPKEDASFNLRVENRKRLAYYLADRPFGMGITGHVVDTRKLSDRDDEEFIATDSAWVEVWVKNGIVGLSVNLFFWAVVLLRCSYVLLFKVRHRQLRLVLAGMVGVVFGLLVQAYAGRAMDFYPCGLHITMFMAFVLNGPYIDKQMKPDEDL